MLDAKRDGAWPLQARVAPRGASVGMCSMCSMCLGTGELPCLGRWPQVVGQCCGPCPRQCVVPEKQLAVHLINIVFTFARVTRYPTLSSRLQGRALLRAGARRRRLPPGAPRHRLRQQLPLQRSGLRGGAHAEQGEGAEEGVLGGSAGCGLGCGVSGVG